MIQNYNDLTRLEMEQVDKDETIVLIPLGAPEQHGNQVPLGMNDIITEAMTDYIRRELEVEDSDFSMLIFPVISVGLSIEYRDLRGSVTFKPGTYYHTLYDINTGLVCHGSRKLVFLVHRGGDAPVVQVLSRELRSEFGISPFILSSGVSSRPDVTTMILEGNIWDLHGGEMETPMAMTMDPSLVKSRTSEAGIPTTFEDSQALEPYENTSIGWVSEDRKTADGKPIGIGEDPSSVTAEKGRIILETSAKVLVPGLKEIRTRKG